jgi:hypothetical protein
MTDLEEAREAVRFAVTRHLYLGPAGFAAKGADPEDLLIEHPLEVATAVAFLRKCKKSRYPRLGSYRLKHLAEEWGAANGLSSYVCNGALIAAAVYLGFVVEPHTSGPNANIGVGHVSVKRAMKSVVKP